MALLMVNFPDVILNYLYDVYERNIDIQCRFKWTAGASGELLCWCCVQMDC